MYFYLELFKKSVNAFSNHYEINYLIQSKKLVLLLYRYYKFSISSSIVIIPQNFSI